jgi:predicted SAM-dependent methyltransferase
VNVGCGPRPTPGFVNLDNSWSVRLSRLHGLRWAIRRLPLLRGPQREFIERARAHDVVWAEATRLPIPDGTAALVYSCHMLEHLSRPEASAFLEEARRVLAPGGWIRLVVPDLRRRAARYLQQDGDADTFVESILMASSRPVGVLAKLQWLAVGPRHHLWMYDAASLGKLLADHRFVNVTELAPGRTNVADPGSLDLHERVDDSVYVEGQKTL